MRRITLTLTAIVGLAACAPGAPGTFGGATLAVSEAISGHIGDTPLDTGPVTVLTEEHGALHSYTFASCGEGTVCSGARRGLAEMSDEGLKITGTHAGRTFYLTPGGGGRLELGGVVHPLAWEDPNAASALAPTRFSWDEIKNQTVR